MPSLYDLNNEYCELQAMLEHGAETPEDEQAIITALEAVQDDIEGKADAYAKIMRNLAAEAEMLKAEENRLYKLRKARENGIDRLKNAIYNTMTLLGAKKVKTSIGNWNIQKNPWSVKVVDASKVPERFLIPQQPEVDKKAMLAEFKETAELFDGVEICQTEGVRFR